ncbi:stable inheritance protein KleA [Rhodoferax sp.]|uniref:stable inheritance protein KleA n=1 Tax=Rhodoferax sp. TaxID=50421 RepID=UPI00275CBC35|nr:stable inheritance protein KleA [Rhodoferax sp.]
MTTANTNTTATNGEATCNAMGGRGNSDQAADFSSVAILWVGLLQGVSVSILKEREYVAELMRNAADLGVQASRMQARATELRAQAYYASLALESRIRNDLWTREEIEAAKLEAARIQSANHPISFNNCF